MRVFTELFIDELRILVADQDYEIDFYYYAAGDPDGSPDHGYVMACTQLGEHAFVYGTGNTPEEALVELQSMVMLYYEVAIDDFRDLSKCHKRYVDEIKWWMDHWRYTKVYVPDEVADLDTTDYERWEEWNRKYDHEHVKYLVTGEYKPAERKKIYVSAGGRKTKLDWI
jgi:hypothetical protein